MATETPEINPELGSAMTKISVSMNAYTKKFETIWVHSHTQKIYFRNL